MSNEKVEMPGILAHWTADEVAECLPYSKHMEKAEADTLYCRLWEVLESASNKTPLGGDGTGGTVETPEERLSPDNDDKTPHWWDKLTHKQQVALTLAVKDEYNE